MRCTHCGTETEAGTSFTFYVGTHTRASLAQQGGISLTPAADRVVGAEQVFLCSACQIRDRHRAFRRATLICGVVLVLSPAIAGLLLFPSLVPAWSKLSAFLLSAPVVGIVIGVGGTIGLGLLARSAIDAFGAVVWIACTWRKPYARSGDDPNFDHTVEGEAFAIRARRAAVGPQGSDVCYTRKAQSRLGQSARGSRIITTVLAPVGLFVLGLCTLACIGVGGLLVNWLR